MTHDAAIADALLDPERAVPSAIDLAHQGRFAIYRNNVFVSLIEALKTRFPATLRTVGDEAFIHLARSFIVLHPPTSPLIMFYGDTFGNFLDDCFACADLPYLGDLARLEASRTRAFHAADVTPLGPSTLARLTPEALATLRVSLHPAVAIIASPHPIVTIWAMNVGDVPLAPIDNWHGEEALLSRPALDVEVRALPPGGAEFLIKLAEGETLAAAATAAGEAAIDFDLPVNLAGLFSYGIVAGISHA